MHNDRTTLLLASIDVERKKLKEAREAFVIIPCADANEAATFQENLNIVATVMQRAQQRLRQLEQCIEVSEMHTTCEDCGEEIPMARLLARPDTVRCTACQEAWEEEQGYMVHSHSTKTLQSTLGFRQPPSMNA